MEIMKLHRIQSVYTLISSFVTLYSLSPINAPHRIAMGPVTSTYEYKFYNKTLAGNDLKHDCTAVSRYEISTRYRSKAPVVHFEKVNQFIIVS